MSAMRKYLLEDSKRHVIGFKSYKGNEDRLSDAMVFLSNLHKGNYRLFVYNEDDIELNLIDVNFN